MKKIILTILSLGILTACSKNDDEPPVIEELNFKTETVSNNNDTTINIESIKGESSDLRLFIIDLTFFASASDQTANTKEYRVFAEANLEDNSTIIVEEFEVESNPRIKPIINFERIERQFRLVSNSSIKIKALNSVSIEVTNTDGTKTTITNEVL